MYDCRENRTKNNFPNLWAEKPTRGKAKGLKGCIAGESSRAAEHWQREKRRSKMFATAVRLFSRRQHPPLRECDLRVPPEQAAKLSKALLEVIQSQGPLTIPAIWDCVKDAGIQGLNSKQQLKIMVRWLRERQKIRLICNHVGNTKQFLCTTWLTKPSSIIGSVVKQASKTSGGSVQTKVQKVQSR